VFELHLGPGSEWKCCLEARPEVDGTLFQFAGDPHQPADKAAWISLLSVAALKR
jgi:hypothetical protein